MTPRTPARIALDAHTSLCEFLKHPPARLVEEFDRYITEGGEVVRRQRHAGYKGLTAVERSVLNGWDYYTWPAKTGTDLIRLTAEPLSAAPTYQVTAEIVEAVSGMYGATAAAGPVLRESEMPSPCGFAWLDEPVTLADFGGEVIATRALSWGPMLFKPPGIEPAEGTRVTSWAESDLAAYRSRDITGPGSSASVFVPYGEPITAGVSDDPTRWLHCLWLFMDTEIVVAAREQAERAARRRAERTGLDGDVTVIMLPHRNYPEAGDGQRDIDWSCRWVVQGHDRHLGDYRPAGYEPHHAKASKPRQPCSVCGERTTRVRAYVKGPDGMPLKPDGKVFRVAQHG